MKKYHFNIGELIFTVRKLNGLSQIDFSTKVGVAQSTLSKIEAGVFIDTPFSLVSKISEIFDVPLEFFSLGYFPLRTKVREHNLFPLEYVTHGALSIKTVFQLCEYLNENLEQDVYKKIKIARPLFSLVHTSFNFRFIDKLIRIFGKSIILNFIEKSDKQTLFDEAALMHLQKYLNKIKCHHIQEHEEVVDKKKKTTSVYFKMEKNPHNELYLSLINVDINYLNQNEHWKNDPIGIYGLELVLAEG